MIKKLNKHRVRRERPLTSFYFDKDTSDYWKINIQLWDIEFELRELREQIWIHALRLRFAIANTKSFEIKTQLKFKEKIVLFHKFLYKFMVLKKKMKMGLQQLLL